VIELIWQNRNDSTRRGIEMAKPRLMTTFALFAVLALVASGASAQTVFEISEVSSASARDETVEYEHSVDADDGDRLLLVFVGGEGLEDETAPFEVTAGGTAMTVVPGAAESIQIGHGSAFYLLEEDLPAGGGVTIIAGATGLEDIHSTAVTIQNARQEGPTAEAGNTTGGEQEVSVEIATVVDLCLLIDQIYTGAGLEDGGESFDDLTPHHADQNVIGGTDEPAESSMTNASSRYVSPAGTYTNGWDQADAGNRLVLSIVYVKAAVGAERPPPPEQNQGPTEVPVGMPVGAPLALGLVALLLGVTGVARARRK
jgi:hypothetical protein